MTVYDKFYNYISLIPRTIIYRTILLCLCYFTVGMTDSARGPTLLDIRDIVGVETSDMSYAITLTALGCLIGCFATGAILDRFPPAYSYCYIVISGTGIGIGTITYPFSTNLFLLYLNALWFGFCNGCFHTCTNSLLLRIWKGRNSSPYMFALHFNYGAGALLAPLVAKPFLRSQPVDVSETVPLETETFGMAYIDPTSHQQISSNSTLSGPAVTTDGYTVKTLFPILGIQFTLVCFSLLYFFIKDVRCQAERIDATNTVLKRDDGEMVVVEVVVSKDRQEREPVLTRRQMTGLMLLMVLQFFCCAGLEISTRSYISTFAVVLGHSRQIGSDVLAFYYSSFATARGLMIFGGFFLDPSTILWASIVLCTAGNTLLSLLAKEYLVMLQLGTVLVGGGTTLLFPAGMLWLQKLVPITNRRSAVINVACNLSVQMFSLLIGSVIEDNPMLFLYLMTFTSGVLAVVFTSLNILARSFKKGYSENKAATVEKLIS